MLEKKNSAEKSPDYGKRIAHTESLPQFSELVKHETKGGGTEARRYDVFFVASSLCGDTFIPENSLMGNF